MFRKVLIANRGEIARRLVQAAHRLGIATVGVYADPDADSPHLAQCAEIVRLGPAAPALSYLNQDRLIQVATRMGCDCVHPGYGFFAENAGFAAACLAAGLGFIGPPPEAIACMGDKRAAKALAERHGVPTIPGFVADLGNLQWTEAQAQALGYPLLVKPAAGGGGKGMHVVSKPEDLAATLARAGAEAQQAFGEAALLVERFLTTPRHIEIQIVADTAGTVLDLGERECSIQRRHQKLIEEAPAPLLVADALAGGDLRARMADAAISVARACGYVTAGTVEFLADADSGAFYFLEMNTRLQVEHPVTELTHGVDLAALMFTLAAGEPLPFGPKAHREAHGVAVEARIIAEDPYDGFAPSFGLIERFDLPGGLHVRVDAGVRAGNVVTPHYDSLLAKCIAWGEARDEALDRLDRALAEFTILGPDTAIPFQRHVLRDPGFRAGEMTIHTASKLLQNEAFAKPAPEVAAALAVALEHAPPENGSLSANREPNGTASIAARSAWARAPRSWGHHAW